MRWLLAFALVTTLWLAAPARAAPQALDDAALSEVSAAGIGLGVHLELNSGLLSGQAMQPNLIVGFGDALQPVYLVMHGVGGIMDLYNVTLNLRRHTDGSDYLDLGLPGFVGFDQFGVRALSVQTDPTAAPGAGNFGSLMLNGTGAMTGHVLMWAR
jgi:hypothetical protein